MREEGDGEEMECKVTDGGLIEVRFPGKGEGRYIFAIDGVSDDGQRERIIEGYVGYEGPAMKEVGNEDGVELLVYMDGERRKALFGRNMAWVSMYKASQEVAEQVKEVDKKLEKAEALDKAFSEKMSDFVQPDETTGTWVVGGVDTGKPYRGENGADGQKIKRVTRDWQDPFPSAGDGGTLLYERAAESFIVGSVDSPVYLYVAYAENMPAKSGFKINGIEVVTDGGKPLSHWVDVLNSGFDFAVKAELVSMRWIKLAVVYDGVQLSVGGGSIQEMYLQRYLGFTVYGWIDGKGWVNLENQLELEQLPLAREGVVGAVKIVSSVEGADDTKGELPKGGAIVRYVRDKISNLATKAELEPLATRDELGVFATKAELEPLATKEELEQAVAQTPSNVVSSAFGKKIVELSETEYSLLESYDEDTYYFTFAD